VAALPASGILSHQSRFHSEKEKKKGKGKKRGKEEKEGGVLSRGSCKSCALTIFPTQKRKKKKEKKKEKRGGTGRDSERDDPVPTTSYQRTTKLI